MIALLMGVWSCEDIPRDNPLDPKNPNSTRSRKILIEAFVNTNNPLPYNQFALTALDSLSQLHSNKVVILEYHRNTRDYTDPYHLPENEALYQSYIDLFDGVAGVPDVFFNIRTKRVQGASSVANSFTRFTEALSGLLNRNSQYALELNYRVSDTSIIPEITLAKLGEKDARNIRIKAILIAEIDRNNLKRVVRDFATQDIASLPQGTFNTYTLLPLTLREPQKAHSLVAYVTDQFNTEVYQSEIIEIK